MKRNERIVILKALKTYEPKNKSERNTVKNVRLTMFGLLDSQIEARKFDSKIEKIVNILLAILISTLLVVSIIMLLLKHFA